MPGDVIFCGVLDHLLLEAWQGSVQLAPRCVGDFLDLDEILTTRMHVGLQRWRDLIWIVAVVSGRLDLPEASFPGPCILLSRF